MAKRKEEPEPVGGPVLESMSEGEARTCSCCAGGECVCCGPRGRRVGRLICLGGIALTALLSLVLNDPRTPAPVVLWGIATDVVFMGWAACWGCRWLLKRSDVAFAPDGPPPVQLDIVAKLVLWVGLGVALPTCVLATIGFLIARRPPFEMMGYLVCLLRTFLPTACLCALLLPFAWQRIRDAERFSARDRGAVPLAAGLLAYGLLASIIVMPGPHHGILGLLGMLLGAVLPGSWPLHLMAVAFACGVLRLWFVCTSCGICCKEEGAATPGPGTAEA